MLDESALFDVGLEDVPRQEVVVLAVDLVASCRSSCVRHGHFEERWMGLHEPFAQLVSSDVVRADENDWPFAVRCWSVHGDLLVCYYFAAI